jgi:hypothetical protein
VEIADVSLQIELGAGYRYEEEGSESIEQSGGWCFSEGAMVCRGARGGRPCALPLPQAAAGDRKAVGTAIARLLKDAAGE